MIRKKIIIVLSIICVLLISFCIFNYSEYTKLKNENTRLKKDVSTKQDKIKNNEDESIILKSNYEKLEKEKQNIVKRYNSWEEKNKKIKSYLQ